MPAVVFVALEQSSNDDIGVGVMSVFRHHGRHSANGGVFGHGGCRRQEAEEQGGDEPSNEGWLRRVLRHGDGLPC